MRLLGSGLVALALLGSPPRVLADAAGPAQLLVAARVLKTCKLAVPSSVVARYDPTAEQRAHALVHDSSIGVRCTRGTRFNVVFDPGQNFAGTRRLRGDAAGAYLSYDVCRDPSCAQPWPSAGVARTAQSSQPVRVDAVFRVPAAQDVPGGVYRDQMQVTLEF